MKNKVLLVEDEEDIRDLMALVLSKDFDLDLAPNGIEALAMIKSKDYDVILTDYNLPELSGPNLIKLIKEFKPLQKTVLLTGHSDMTLIQAQNFGATGLFKKPFDFNKLILYVKNL